MPLVISDRDNKLMEEALQDLSLLLEKQDVDRAFELVDLFSTQLAAHIRSENVCLFPAILNAPRDVFGKKSLPPFEEVKATIEQLRTDHVFFIDQISQAARQIRKLMLQEGMPNSDLANQLAEIHSRIETVLDRLHIHRQTEEDHVYKWPEIILPPEQHELLTIVMSAEVEKIPRRVERLV